MPLYGVGDMVRAQELGQTHTQWFTKTSATQSSQNNFIDWGFTNGSGGNDPRIGSSLEFTPRISTNQAGGINTGTTPSAGQTKHITAATMALVIGGTTNIYDSLIFYDLLGYYPLIDGTIPDTQTMDNTQALPRYTDGDGVMGFIMGHVSPTTANGTGTMTYVDQAGSTKTTAVRTITLSNNVNATAIAGASATGAVWIPLASGSRGIRRVVDINFSTAQPGGSLVLCLVKPLFTMLTGGTVFSNSQFATEFCFTCHRAANYPRVYDGASIQFMMMHNGGNNTVTNIHGSLTFTWG